MVKAYRSLLLSLLFITLVSLHCYSQCNAPSQPVVTNNNVTPTSITVSWTCTGCSANYIVEYGLTGFQPGMDNNPGIGGTITTSTTTSKALTGLTPNTNYDIYVRQNCGATYSLNSTPITRKTAVDCSTVPAITCGTTYTVSLNPGGVWSVSTCNGTTYTQQELIYSFTPSVTGTYYLISTSRSCSNCLVNYSYKQMSAGCTGTGWTCIGYDGQNPAVPGVQQTVTFTAGVTYLIYIDASASTSVQFRLECVTSCPQLAANFVNRTVSTIGISWTGSDAYIEYGAANFMPGTGTNAGTNGTLIHPFSSPYTIQNLTPNTSYDIYLRQNCSGTLSANSIKLNIPTAACPIEPPLGTPSFPAPGKMLAGFYNFFQSTINNWNSMGGCFPAFNTNGREKIIQFTPQYSGTYTTYLTYAGTPQLSTANRGAYNFYYRQTTGVCNNVNYQCVQEVFNSQVSSDIYQFKQFTLSQLTAGTTYDLLLELVDSTIFSSNPNPYYRLDIHCLSPSGLAASTISPTTATINWSCFSGCSGVINLEYGPSGFNPGTGSTAGANGTLLTNVTAPYLLTGLQPNTLYDIYIRSNCGAGFGANSTKHTFRTSTVCTGLPEIVCGDYLSYTPSANGAWLNYSCSPSVNFDGVELKFQFTTSDSGMYSIILFDKPTNYVLSTGIYYKDISGTCDETGWNCIATPSSSNSIPQTYAFGPLTANSTYMIMLDGYYSTSFFPTPSFKYRLLCPNSCPNDNISAGTTGVSSITVNASTCVGCSGSAYLEYGPPGFTPGNGSLPGNGGTVVPNVTYPYTINGLSSGTSYDIYVRRKCSFNYSTNGTKISVSTQCNAAPTSIITQTAGTSFCGGDSITLQRVGGSLLSSGAQYVWYTGTSSPTTLVGTGDSVKIVAPLTTTTLRYFVRVESPCENTAYIQILLNITTLGTATVIITQYDCPIQLKASATGGTVYQWILNGNPIAGATSSTYSATSSGNYSCIISASGNTCSKTSNVQNITSGSAITPSNIYTSPSTNACGGEILVLNTIPSAGTSNQWLLNNAPIISATGTTYSVTSNGSYSVVRIAQSGCVDTSSAVVISGVFPTAITVSQQPDAASGKDAVVISSLPTQNFGNSGELNALSVGSSVMRSFLQFDLNFIPAGSAITNASLSLLFDLSSSNGISHSGSNASFLARVTAPFDENTLNYSNQPAITSVNMLNLASLTGVQNLINTSVTNLITDMKSTPGNDNGFYFGLVTEQPTKKVLFSSSDNLTASRRPKLDVTFSLSLQGTLPTLTITGSDSICTPATNVIYTASPLTSGATYTWTVPSGAVINSGQGSNSISVDIPFAAHGNISVVPTNLCGNGSTSTLNINAGQCVVILNLSAFIQGYYQNGNMTPALFNSGTSADSTATDSLVIELHDPVNLQLVKSTTALLHTNGTATALFDPSVLNNQYYIVIGTRTGIETWSVNPVLMLPMTYYNFTE